MPRRTTNGFTDTHAVIDGAELWSGTTGLFLLWYKYLEFSESYARVGRINADSPSAKVASQLPADHKVIAGVREDFGDVVNRSFTEWWFEKGLSVCGAEGEKPAVAKISRINSMTLDSAPAARSLKNYIKKSWPAQGHPDALLVAIPVDLPASQIKAQVLAEIERTADLRTERPIKAPKYKIEAQRVRTDKLNLRLRCLMHRARSPHKKLWEIGAIAHVSSTYTEKVLTDESLDVDTRAYYRRMLTQQTSRALLEAQHIAENAARGRFPLTSKPATFMKTDFERIRNEVDWYKSPRLRSRRYREERAYLFGESLAD